MSDSPSSVVRHAVFVAAAVVGLSDISHAAVTYTYYDATSTSQVDLAFTVSTQLATELQTEPTLSVTGAYAADFPVGLAAEYAQGSPGYQPTISLYNDSSGFQLSAAYSDFPYGNTSNGVPGNGNFAIDGMIFVIADDNFESFADLGSGTIAGVPEPASIGVLAAAAVGLFARRQRRSSVSPMDRGNGPACR